MRVLVVVLLLLLLSSRRRDIFEFCDLFFCGHEKNLLLTYYHLAYNKK